MEYYQYYDGTFSEQQELDYNDRWLVACIEAAWHCESHKVSYIRYYPLRSKCSDVIKRHSKYTSNLSSGSLDSILRSDRCKGLLKVRRRVGKKKNETRIYPNIPLIQKVVNDRKVENFNSKDKPRFRLLGKDDIVQRRVYIDEPPVSISERLEVKVIRANPKKRLKTKHANIY